MEVLHIYIYCTTLFTIKIYHLIRSTTIYTNSRLHCKSSKSLSHYFRSVTRVTIFSFLHCTRKKNILVWIYLVLPGHNQYTDTHTTHLPHKHEAILDRIPYTYYAIHYIKAKYRRHPTVLPFTNRGEKRFPRNSFLPCHFTPSRGLTHSTFSWIYWSLRIFTVSYSTGACYFVHVVSMLQIGIVCLRV